MYRANARVCSAAIDHLGTRVGHLPRARVFAALMLLAALGFGGCAQQPQQLAASAHSKEYFPSSVYGAASRRVVDGGPVPHGGGQYLVGKPYTVAGQTYYPSERKRVQVGNASWYGDAFHGRLTANGEIYDRDSFTAAHPTMPLPSYARVTNLRNNTSMIVRVNDRGPFASNRVMDVSRRVADALDFRRSGTAKVRIEYVGRASLAGSDDAKLYATLRNDGPAQWHESEPTMVAERQAPARVASLEPIVPAATPREEPTRRAAISRREEIEAERQRADSRRVQPSVRRPQPEEERPVAHWQRGPSAVKDMRPLPERESPTSLRAVHVASREERAPVARSSIRSAPRPAFAAQEPLPPSRHIDLGTIPGADVPIGPLHHKPGLRLSRAD